MLPFPDPSRSVNFVLYAARNKEIVVLFEVDLQAVSFSEMHIISKLGFSFLSQFPSIFFDQVLQVLMSLI